MTPGVWVIGAGGHAKVAVATLAAAGRSVLGMFDADPLRRGDTILGIAVQGPLPALDWWSEGADQAFTAIGNNETRRRLAGLLPRDRWATAIHPSAVVHDSAVVAEGSLVCAQAVVHPDARVGAHAIVNTASVVEHDCTVGSYCHLAPRSCLAGSVSVGEGSFIGAGATVVPGIAVGARCVVGAGATVIRDVPDGTTVGGVPARPLRRRTAE
jgi:sugar O-acyltransferase (sialic acid O-acetyltransferase NeuD family)